MNEVQEKIPGMHVWLVLWKAYRAMEAIDKKSIASLGLGGISDFALLESLLSKGAAPVNTIGKKIGLTSGSITAAVDRAEAKKWVTRLSDPNDRRVVIIDLTEDGRRVIEESLGKHAASLEKAATVLNAEERVTLINLLKKIGYHAEKIGNIH